MRLVLHTLSCECDSYGKSARLSASQISFRDERAIPEREDLVSDWGSLSLEEAKMKDLSESVREFKVDLGLESYSKATLIDLIKLKGSSKN
jgi:hypothetical protein